MKGQRKVRRGILAQALLQADLRKECVEDFLSLQRLHKTQAAHMQTWQCHGGTERADLRIMRVDLDREVGFCLGRSWGMTSVEGS